MELGEGSRSVERGLILLSGIASLMVLFILIPIISLYLNVKLGVLRELFKPGVVRGEVVESFKVTLLASIVAVIILVALGVPLAYILARKNFPGKRIIEGLIDIPLALPHAVAGIMILQAFSSNGLLRPLTGKLGLYIKDHFMGIVVVMAFVSSPLLIDTVKIGFQSIPQSLESVARTLGASQFRVFLDISLPLAYRSILAGSLLAWARGLSEVGALLIVAYYPKTVNILILEYLSIYGLAYATALAAVYATLALGIFTALRLVVKQ